MVVPFAGTCRVSESMHSSIHPCTSILFEKYAEHLNGSTMTFDRKIGFLKDLRME